MSVQVSVLTIDIGVGCPGLMLGFVAARREGWIHRSSAPCTSALRSIAGSWSFPAEAVAPASPWCYALFGPFVAPPHSTPTAPVPLGGVAERGQPIVWFAFHELAFAQIPSWLCSWPGEFSEPQRMCKCT